MTTSARRRSSKPAGSNSLNARVPAAPVKLLASKRGRAGRTTTGGSAGSAMPASELSLAARRLDLTSRTKPSSTLARSRGGSLSGAATGPAGARRRGGCATAERARWIAVVASISLPRRVRPPAARSFRSKGFFKAGFSEGTLLQCNIREVTAFDP
jgi:hypothetical protein